MDKTNTAHLLLVNIVCKKEYRTNDGNSYLRVYVTNAWIHIHPFVTYIVTYLSILNTYLKLSLI